MIRVPLKDESYFDEFREREQERLVRCMQTQLQEYLPYDQMVELCCIVGIFCDVKRDTSFYTVILGDVTDCVEVNVERNQLASACRSVNYSGYTLFSQNQTFIGIPLTDLCNGNFDRMCDWITAITSFRQENTRPVERTPEAVMPMKVLQGFSQSS